MIGMGMWGTPNKGTHITYTKTISFTAGSKNRAKNVKIRENPETGTPTETRYPAFQYEW
jgi:hypothetical protein